MAVILGLAAAVTYGAADFVGGLVSRRAHVLTVVLISQLVGSTLLFSLVPFVDGRFGAQPLAWGGLAGVAGATGIVLLYRGLARGRMSIVAPITAVEAAALPVVAGVIVGERPSTISAAGVVIALAAIALVSLASGPDEGGTPVSSRASRRASTLRTPGIPEALGAGVAFAAFFILLERAGDDTGLWPLVGSRLASMIAVIGALLIVRAPVRPPPSMFPAIALSGILDVGANVFYLLATREGLLSIVAVLTSLYPASTVLLARIVLKERLGSRQVLGLACAAAGVTMIATG